MSEQQKSTPPTDTGKGRGSRTEADPTPPKSEDPAVGQPFSDEEIAELRGDGVELYRGEGKDRVTVTAFKPGTITRLKSEGWMLVEDEDA